MRLPHLVVLLVVLAAGAARAQLAITQPTTRLLLLPLAVSTPADSSTSVATMDAARDRLAALAKYKVIVVAKVKVCDALKASGFDCDVLLDDAQARLLARLLNVHAYTTGVLERNGSALTARIRVVDIGSSGYAFAFSATSGNPGTPAALGEAVAQRLNTIVRAGESARDCTDRRSKGQLDAALDAARKALSIEPNLTAAHLCTALVYEVKRMPAESLIAAAQRAIRGDSINATAWETVARSYQQKGDTVRAIDAFQHELLGDPQNIGLRLAVADLLRQQRQYQRAVSVLDEGLARAPSDEKLLALRSRVCIEGELRRCTLEGFVVQALADSTRLADSSFLKAAIGAAQNVPDTERAMMFSRKAVQRFPMNAAFWKALGQAFELRGMPDSALAAYRKSLTLDPNDMRGTLLVAKAMVDGAVYDTAQANRLKGDSVALAKLRTAFANRLDTARTFLSRALSSSDSTQLGAAVILLTGGSKLAQAAAYDRAYSWLDQALTLVAPHTPDDTVGSRQQVRIQTSFWFGIASVASLSAPYSEMVKTKSCAQARAINERIARTHEALVLGARVQASFANQMLQNLMKFEAIMPQVKKQFHCTNY